MRRAIPGIVVLMLAGCAARPPACPIEQLAIDAVRAGQSAPDLVAANPGCSAAGLTQAHARALATRCAPEQGWQDGLAGTPTPRACPEQAGRAWREAYNLGDRQREFSAELERIEARITTLKQSGDPADQAAVRRLGLERVRLVRELDTIRGAAQIRGWTD